MRRSVSRATTMVTNRTTPTMARRCQSGMRSYSPGAAPILSRRSQRLASGEAFLQPVPELDLRLAELPAQEHVLVAATRGKIQQAFLDRLDLGAGGVDPLSTLSDRIRLTLDRQRDLPQIAWMQIAAVAGDLRHELGLLMLRLDQLPTVLDHLLDDRPQLVERRVCLPDGEDPHDVLTIIVLAMGVGQRLREDLAARRELRIEQARNPALGIYVWSRAAIWLSALFAFYWFEPNRHPRAFKWDSPLIHDLGSFTDIWARWDSVFFVRIAQHGYDNASAAFGPLYPGLVAALGHVFFGHYVLAGIVVSLAAALGAFALLHRIAEERLGVEGARRALLYLALFPTALFLQAVYSESLYLLLVLGAFVLAERGRFAAAGLTAGLVVLARVTGLALVPELALAALVTAAVRARDLPVLPRARGTDRGQTATAHGRGRVQLVSARDSRRAVGSLAVGRLNAADIDGVTIDAYGTLATLVDPLPRLQELLPGRDLVEIERAFRAEGSFYAANVQTGRDATTLAQLREACVGVFNDTLGSSLSAEEYIGALVFEPLP